MAGEALGYLANMFGGMPGDYQQWRANNQDYATNQMKLKMLLDEWQRKKAELEKYRLGGERLDTLMQPGLRYPAGYEGPPTAAPVDTMPAQAGPSLAQGVAGPPQLSAMGLGEAARTVGMENIGQERLGKDIALEGLGGKKDWSEWEDIARMNAGANVSRAQTQAEEHVRKAAWNMHQYELGYDKNQIARAENESKDEYRKAMIALKKNWLDIKAPSFRTINFGAGNMTVDQAQQYFDTKLKEILGFAQLTKDRWQREPGVKNSIILASMGYAEQYAKFGKEIGIDPNAFIYTLGNAGIPITWDSTPEGAAVTPPPATGFLGGIAMPGIEPEEPESDPNDTHITQEELDEWIKNNPGK